MSNKELDEQWQSLVKARQERDISFPYSDRPLMLLECVIELWREYLGNNKNYREYCEAKRNGEVGVCEKLEKVFENLPVVYEDWGDFYDESGLSEWETWIKSRRHLFGLCEINFSEDGAVFDPYEYVVNIAVPLYTTKDELLNLVSDFLDKVPVILGEGCQYKVTSIKGMDLYKIYEMLIKYNYIVATLDANPSVKGEIKYGGVSSLMEDLVDESSALMSYLKMKWDTKKGGNPTAIYRMLNDYYKCVDATIYGEFPRRSRKDSDNSDFTMDGANPV